MTYLVGILFGSALSFEWLSGMNFHGLEKVAPYALLVLWVITKLNIPDLMEFALTLPLSAILVIRLPANCPKAVRYWA